MPALEKRKCSDITWNNYISLRNAVQEIYVAAEEYTSLEIPFYEQQILRKCSLL